MKSKYIIIALILSAMAGLIYEMVSMNYLFFYFAESSYSTATVLTVFLSGLGIGSFTFYKNKDKIKNKKFLFGILQVVIGIYAFIVLSNLDKIVFKINTLGLFLSSVSLLLIPTICLGVIFPLTGSILKEKNKDEKIGLIYSMDLIGAVIGVLIAGFFLIPNFGNKATVLFAVMLNFGSASLVFKKKALSIFAIFLIPIFFISAQVINQENEIIPSEFGEVKVEDGKLFISGREQCSIHYSDQTTERTIVRESLKNFDSRDLDVLNIGLGCGLSLTEILNYTDNQVDIVEINEKVVEVNKEMTDVLKNPNVNLIIDDGYKYLRSSNKKYDSIIIDIENPSIIYSSNIYTKESFKLVEGNLRRDGVFGLWVVGCGNPRYYDIIYYTLKESFDYVYKLNSEVFLASNKELDYKEYKPRTEKQINTLDKNSLGKLYLESCG